MIVEMKSKGLHTCRLDIPNKDSKEAVYLLSDVHFDSRKCDRALFFKHLDAAQAEGAGVFILGDLFDLMQGRFDPRGNYDSLRPEYKQSAYLDDVITDVANQLKGYDCIKFVGQGNHETNIIRRMHVDPIQRFAALMNQHGNSVATGQYAGWIIFRCSRHTAQKSFKLHYHHGYGGNAKRSKGVLNVDIDMKDHPDADIIARGHTHQKWYHPVMRDRINGSFNHYQQVVHVLQTGSYKLKDMHMGWEVEKGFSTPRVGGWRLEFTPSSKQEIADIQVSELC